MDIVSINDKDYVNTDSYKSFMKSNNGYGYLRIRASAASQAIPISGVKVIVSKMIDNKKVVFFEGETDTSGMIMQIEIKDEYIKLGQAMKLAGLVSSGVDAKFVIQDGQVKVNGEMEVRRGRKLKPGDSFEFDNTLVTIK